MASGVEDDRRRERKMTESRDKPTPRCGRGRIAGGSSSEAARGDSRDRGRDKMIQEEENL